jgi:hypothetical protein
MIALGEGQAKAVHRGDAEAPRKTENRIHHGGTEKNKVNVNTGERVSLNLKLGKNRRVKTTAVTSSNREAGSGTDAERELKKFIPGSS